MIHNEHNVGYTKNVNQGLGIDVHSDVVLLNSDTVVGPRWLGDLRAVAYSGEKVAAVSAISDNAGAMSIPEKGVFNDWGDPSDWDRVAREFLHSPLPFWGRIPTAHGFCMYLRREAIEEVGLFDEVSFPRGYGEENDWSMRAIHAGWECRLATRVMVHHAQGASFGEGRAELIASARATVNELHPGYSESVRSWMNSSMMSDLRDRAAELLDQSRQRLAKPRVMYVLHFAGGGTPETNRDLMTQLAARQDSYVLLAKESEVALYQFDSSGMRRLLTWAPDPIFAIQDAWRSDYAEFVFRVIWQYGIELVHIRHLINQPLTTLPIVCKRLGVPVILSTHDFYYICPTVNLLDGDLQYCGGVCTPGSTRCFLPNAFVAGAVNLKHQWINVWRERASEVLDIAAKVVVTTDSAEGVYARNYPSYTSKVVKIEHGRDIASPGGTARRPAESRGDGPIRVVCPANWAPHKGVGLVNALIAETHPLVEWHILGGRSDLIDDRAVQHGPYKREMFGELVRAIDPDYVGLFSIWPETYSHTLTEAWSLGVPVLATDLGAIADRIRMHGGGRYFDHAKPDELVRFLIEEARKPLRRSPLDRPVPKPSFRRSAKTMAEGYRLMYEAVHIPHRAPVVGYVPSAGRGARYVRLSSRMARVDAGTCQFKEIVPADYVSGSENSELDCILVQRDALDPALTDAFLDRVQKSNTRLVFELDDDLLPSEADSRELRDQAVRHPLLKIARVADAVVVSTEALAARLGRYGIAASVVPNLVDHHAWRASTGTPAAQPTGQATRLVYWGTRSHLPDLEMFRDSLEWARRSAPETKIELDVVGVADADGTWFNRLIVPEEFHRYELFARWMAQMKVERGWNGAIAPLESSVFNRSKSDIKVLESLALGIPIVASNVGPYAAWSGKYDDVVQVVDNNEADWARAILRIGSPAIQRVDEALDGRLVTDESETRRWLSLVLGQ